MVAGVPTIYHGPVQVLDELDVHCLAINNSTVANYKGRCGDYIDTTTVPGGVSLPLQSDASEAAGTTGGCDFIKDSGMNQDLPIQRSKSQIIVSAAVIFTLYSLYRTQHGSFVEKGCSPSRARVTAMTPDVAAAAVLSDSGKSARGTLTYQNDPSLVTARSSNGTKDYISSSGNTVVIASNTDGVDYRDRCCPKTATLVRISLPLASLDILASFIPSFQKTAAHQALRIVKVWSASYTSYIVIRRH
jgi:hypothetical protein